MSKDQWRTFGLFCMLDLGIAFFVSETLAVGLVGVAAFVLVIRNAGKLPKISTSGGAGSNNK